MWFAASIGCVLVCLIGLSAILGHRSGKVPVVTADTRPIRVRPENPGGMRIDGADSDVYAPGTENARSKLAPAAEVPNLAGMHSATSPAPPAAPAPSVAPRTVTQAADQPSATPPPSAMRPPAPVTPPVRPVSPPVASIAAARPPPAKVAPPKVATAKAAAANPLPGGVASANSGRETASPNPIREAASGNAGRAVAVQLGALGSEQAAREQWAELSKRMPDLLNGREPAVSHFERNGHSFWRLRTAGFADMSQAKAFCERVRAKGSDCAVAGT